MKFLRIEPTDASRWQQVWDLYEVSFPTAEKRKEEDHKRAMQHPQFQPMSIWEGDKLIGILFYWEWDSYRYLEYFAILPELRGKGYGTRILRYLRNNNYTIVLEIDPLRNELSVRRLQFYERLGFTLTPYRFNHLPYRLETDTEELLILSYPEMITKEQHSDFLQFMNREVMPYCEVRQEA